MNDREYWLEIARKIGDPLLDACAQRKLHLFFPEDRDSPRRSFAYLEATGRYLAGIAPWLELAADGSEESICRLKYGELAREVLDAITDPSSPDCAQWGESVGRQPLVDASFVALALVRAPCELIDKLDQRVKQNLIRQLNVSRKILPYQNNWLLFGAMLDAALFLLGAEWDKMRIDYALRKCMDWYIGDGMYRDGDDFALDYYNSFVIHPYLVDLIRVIGDQDEQWKMLKNPIFKRAGRFAEILERLISPEGTFPPLGRSMSYRFGAFHALSQAALLNMLPDNLAPAQVRCALTAVIRRIMDVPGNFDANGWLTPGFCGSQPELLEGYISVGSSYLCTTAFLALGVAPDNSFWSAAPQPWSCQKIYSGITLQKDIALEKR